MQPGRPSDQALADHLTARHAIEVTGFALPEGHNPFVVRFRRGDGPDWITRLFGPARLRERAEGEAAILRFLDSHDYPAERCAADDPVSAIGDGGWHVLVTEYAGEGAQENPSMLARLHTEDALTELGDMLGRLHALPAGTGAVARPGGAWHGDARYEGLPSRDIAATEAMLDEVGPKVPAHARASFDVLRARLDGLAGWSDDLSSALVHPDFMWKNIVVTPDGGFVAVDWTGAGWGPRVASFVGLANTALTGGAVDHGRLDAIVRGYRRHVELTVHELDAVADARRIRQLRFAVLSYDASATFGHFGDGTEGWWPNDDDNVALAEGVRAAFARNS